MNTGWTVCDQDYYLGTGQNVSYLPIGIYKLLSDAKTGNLFLTRVQDKFNMPEKVYELDTQLIDHVTRYYKENVDSKGPGNLGVLLAGVKGSGKTITAKQLCNTLGLPVILITRPFSALPSFINDIKQNVLFFIDEYEKVFADPNTSLLLTVMDGAMDNGYKRVFVLTINELFISDNLLERPGRIRYFKRYTDLSLDTIEMVLNDKLKHKELYDETLRFISELKTITIDIIQSIIEEVNLCNASPYTFASIFNVKRQDAFVDIYEVHEDGRQTAAAEFVKRVVLREGIEMHLGKFGWSNCLEVLSEQMFKAKVDSEIKTFCIHDREARHLAFKKQKITK